MPIRKIGKPRKFVADAEMLGAVSDADLAESRQRSGRAVLVGMECDHVLIAAPAQDPQLIEFRDEHIGSRKDWGAYISLITEVHRREIAEVNEFIAQVRTRLEQAMPQHP